MEHRQKQRTLAARIMRIVAKVFLYLFLFILLIFGLVLLPPIQNFIKKKAVGYLENKLHTKVELGKIYISLGGNVIAKDFYIEDRQKDTLAYFGSLKVGIKLFRLAFHSEVDIDQIELENSTMKIHRELPDTAFNFQFIVDAFNPPTTSKKDTAATSSPITINRVVIDHLRLIYNDTINGNDAETSLDHLSVKMNKLDPGLMIYEIPEINVEGLTARLRQSKPLVTTAAPSPGAAPLPLQLILDKIGLKRIHLDYDSDPSAMTASVSIGDAGIDVKSLDLEKQVIRLSSFDFADANTIVVMKKKLAAAVPPIVNTAGQTPGWRIEVASLKLDNNKIKYDDNNSPRQNTGMDYAHIQADSLTLHVDDLLYSSDSISGTVTKGNVNEKSGFALEQFETRFFYGNTGGYLKDLRLKTHGTEIQKDIEVRYPSLAAVKSNPGIIEINADISHSRIALSDILLFNPSLSQQPAFAKAGKTWFLDGKVSGHLNNLNIAKLRFEGLSGTRIDVNGSIAGLPVMQKISADLNINELSTTRADIVSIVPAKSLPSTISIPNTLKLSGKISGDNAGLRTDLTLLTNEGSASVKGIVKQYSDPNKIIYDADIATNSLDIGSILQQQPTLGKLTTSFHVKGVGTDPKKANIAVSGNIASLGYNGYEYRGLVLSGTLANQIANFDAGMKDPNIDFRLRGAADLTKQYPAISIHGMVDSVKAMALHLTPEEFIFRGQVDGEIATADPDRLQGKLMLSQVLIVSDDKRAEMDSLSIVADTMMNGRSIRITSPVANVALEGKFELTDLATIFQQSIQPYFSILPSTWTVARLKPYDFNLNASIVNSPLLSVFAPSIKKIEPVIFHSHFSDSGGFKADLSAPYVDLGASYARNITLEAGTEGKALAFSGRLGEYFAGSNASILNTKFTGTVADNKINLVLNSKDRVQKDKYNIAALITREGANGYKLSILPSQLLLNYTKWNIDSTNEVLIAGMDIHAHNFTLERGGQSLSLSSGTASTNAPLEAIFSSFQLSTLTSFVQPDTSLVAGTMNGKLVFTDLATHPVFTGDLTINQLIVQKDTVGDVKIAMNNREANRYYADVTLTGRGNDLHLTGDYFPTPVNNNNFDFAVKINALPMATADAFSGGSLNRSTGYMDGALSVKGTMSAPKINGNLNFKKAGFNFKMLNSFFTIDQESIKLTDEGIAFDNFEVKDSAGNKLTLNGKVATTNFQNYDFDLDIKAFDFRALNSTKSDNRYFYGQLYFNTNMHISGTESEPVVDGRLSINDKTKMTVVLPQAEPAVTARDGIVEFVDYSAGINDSLFRSPLDTLNAIGFTGMDISMNLQLDKEADMTLVIDEGNGDFLNLKGEASLTADVDHSGKILLSGTYELEEGAYQLSFNLLKRRFEIQKGSKITWQGEPTKADVDITAVYKVSTSPLDLVKNELSEGVSTTQRNTYLQKLPFDVTLKMTGALLKPLISFDIKLPLDKTLPVSNDIVTNVNNRLDELRQESGEMNKQVFSLLLLNRFVAENPFSSSGGSTSVATLAKQSVSKLLAEQLNRLTADLIKGVDVNFGIQASEDYSTGSRADRTDLNVGLSKRLLNDRLTVTVGSDFEIEGPPAPNQQTNNIAGNVALDYKLSKDGRYLLRAYRKNEYEGIIDGYVIETGVGFVITVDYNRFRDIFRSRKARQRINSNLEKADKNETPDKSSPPAKE